MKIFLLYIKKLKRVYFLVFAMLLHAGLSAQEFITTWETTLESESITIPTAGSGFNYNVDWGDADMDTGLTGSATHIYESPGTYTIKITGEFPRIYFNDTGDRLKIMSIEQWGDIAWVSMQRAFRGCRNLVVNATDTPDLSSVTDMSYMFEAANSLGGGTGNWAWDTGSVTNMSYLFQTAMLFNQDISSWDTGLVTNMDSMFLGASSFNRGIGEWNTESVTNMRAVFSNATSFNKALNWDTSSVTTMQYMFREATDFNQPFGSKWNTSSVTNMNLMFYNATSFNRDVSNWNVENVNDFIWVFFNATLSVYHYDKLLVGWNEQNLKFNEAFYAGNFTKYCSEEAQAARKNIIESKDWNIFDGGLCAPEAPIFGRETEFLTILENERFVTKAIAVDPEEDAITYAITGNAPDNGKFTITADGTLDFIIAPDFEIPEDSDLDNIYEVEITATSIGGTVSQIIRVTVVDITTDSNAVWTGVTNTDWNTPSNWSTGIVPTSSVYVLIPEGATNMPVIDEGTNAEVTNITVNEGSSFTINSSSSLTVYGDHANYGTFTVNSGGTLIVQGISNGDIICKRNLPTENWHLISPSVVGETIESYRDNNPVTHGVNNLIGLINYDNENSLWNFQTTTSTGPMPSGQGWGTRIDATDDITFVGRMPTTDVFVEIAESAGGDKLNLVGNPYPSYIPANNNADPLNNILVNNNADLSEQTLWLWDQALYSYVPINQVSETRFISPGQGFFVSSNTIGGTFIFSEEMQSYQDVDVFNRSTSNKSEIILTVSDGGLYPKQTRIVYIENATNGFDNGYDSSVFADDDGSFAIYTQLIEDENKNLGIQSLSNLVFEEQDMVVSVGINSTLGTEITFSAEVMNFPKEIYVYLEDRITKTFTLLEEDVEYKTTLDADINGSGRFYIHTSTEKSLDVDTIDLNYTNIFKTSNDNLRLSGLEQGNASIKVFNMLGKEVMNQSFKITGAVKDISLPTLNSGIYIVALQTETGKSNKKIIIE